MKNSTTAPVEKKSETIEFDTSRRIVEENIHLEKKEQRTKITTIGSNPERSRRKRKLEKTVEATANWTMERKPNKKKNVSMQSNITSTKNCFDS